MAHDNSGLVTRVMRKSHGFIPPVPRDMTIHKFVETASNSVEARTLAEFVAEMDEAVDEAESEEARRLRRKYQKKLSREAGAKARIPTWYDRLNRED
jgi:hypothetical protein